MAEDMENWPCERKQKNFLCCWITRKRKLKEYSGHLMYKRSLQKSVLHSYWQKDRTKSGYCAADIIRLSSLQFWSEGIVKQYMLTKVVVIFFFPPLCLFKDQMLTISIRNNLYVLLTFVQCLLVNYSCSLLYHLSPTFPRRFVSLPLCQSIAYVISMK